MCWRRMTAAPARIFGLHAGTLAKGAPADLVLLDEDEPFVVDERNAAFARPQHRLRRPQIPGPRADDLCRRRMRVFDRALRLELR